MRYVQILSPFLTAPQGSIVSQERLNMSDDKLDEFVAAGYAIECEIDYIPGRSDGETVEVRSAVDPAPGPDEAFPDEVIESLPVPKRSRTKKT